jgi:gliding motility-associated-like protein
VPIFSVLNDTTFTDTIDLDLTPRNIRYRVRAFERFGNDTTSLSNTIVYTPDPKIFVPNAFTPNGDDINSRFVVNAGVIPWAQDYHIKIFDRWGKVVFESRSYADGDSWDGTFPNGKLATEGVYAYHIVTRAIDGFMIAYSGTVTLVR